MRGLRKDDVKGRPAVWDALLEFDIDNHDATLADLREEALHRTAVWVRGHGLHVAGGPVMHVSHATSQVTVRVPVTGTCTRPREEMTSGVAA